MCEDYETPLFVVFYFTQTILNCNDIKSGTIRHITLEFVQWGGDEISGTQGLSTPISKNFSDSSHYFLYGPKFTNENRSKKCRAPFQTRSCSPWND